MFVYRVSLTVTVIRTPNVTTDAKCHCWRSKSLLAPKVTTDAKCHCWRSTWSHYWRPKSLLTSNVTTGAQDYNLMCYRRRYAQPSYHSGSLAILTLIRPCPFHPMRFIMDTSASAISFCTQQNSKHSQLLPLHDTWHMDTSASAISFCIQHHNVSCNAWYIAFAASWTPPRLPSLSALNKTANTTQSFAVHDT
jgi:hypothetical protein